MVDSKDGMCHCDIIDSVWLHDTTWFSGDFHGCMVSSRTSRQGSVLSRLIFLPLRFGVLYVWMPRHVSRSLEWMCKGVCEEPTSHFVNGRAHKKKMTLLMVALLMLCKTPWSLQNLMGCFCCFTSDSVLHFYTTSLVHSATNSPKVPHWLDYASRC